MDWGTVLAVLVALAIFVVGMIVIGGTAGVLMMRVMFKKTGDAPKCPIPGCPFARAMEDTMREAGPDEPMAEVPHETEREKVAV